MAPRQFAAAALSGALILANFPAHAAVADVLHSGITWSISRVQSFVLLKNSYQIKPDGSVWAPNAAEPIAKTELPALLQRMESAERLRALLKLDMILSASAGEKKLTPAEKDDVRRILRENWPVLTIGTRRDFKKYFTPEELADLNRDPPPVDMSEVQPMKDPESEEVPAEEAPAVAATPAPAPTAVLAPPPAAVAAPPSAPPPPVAAPAKPEAKPEPSIGVIKPQPAQALPPPSIDGVTVSANAAALLPKPPPPAPPPAAPPAAAAPPIAVAPPVPAPAPAQIPPSPPPAPAAAAPAPTPATVAEHLKELTQAEFEKFLFDAPYNRDAKALLRIISDKAPDFARARALNAVVSWLPMVVFDSNRAGAGLHSSLITEKAPSGEKNYVVALSPGPILWSKKRLFMGTLELLLPDSPQFYAERHAAVPAVDALNHDAIAARRETGEWGETRFFEDESRRGTFSQEEQAGALLRELLKLDARTSGWGASTYAAAVFSRTAEFMMYARLAADEKNDHFLSPDLRLAYRQWLEEPEEYRDFMVHALSAGRVDALDARKGGPQEQLEFDREAAGDCQAGWSADAKAAALSQASARKLGLYALEGAGLLESKQFEEAQKSIDSDFATAQKPEGDCAKRLEADAAGLKAAAALLHEALEAEKKFRQERAHANP